jgi:hypothetical protein
MLLAGSANLEKHSDSFRNAYVNLALPFFTETQPEPPETFASSIPKFSSFTGWDRLVIKPKEGKKMTIKRLLKVLRKKLGEGVEISSVSWGGILLYLDFLHEEDEQVKNMGVLEAAKEAAEKEREFAADGREEEGGDGAGEEAEDLDPDARFLELKVTAQNQEGGEVLVPIIKCFLN